MTWEPEPPRRPKLFNMRLTDEERALLEQEANRHDGGNISNTVRRIFAGYFRDRPSVE